MNFSDGSLISLLLNYINITQNGTQQINLYSVDATTVIDIISANYDINDCLQNCSNNGYCKLSISNKLICSCFGGYSGSSCKTITNPCMSNNQCLNNSTCIYAPNSTSLYECKCDESKYFGANCEFKVDMCSNMTCSGHGVCEIDESVNLPFCACFKYYNGTNCETKSQDLVIIDTIISVASIMAIVSVILFYSIFVFNDVLSLIYNSMKMKKKIDPLKANYLSKIPVKYKYHP